MYSLKRTQARKNPSHAQHYQETNQKTTEQAKKRIVRETTSESPAKQTVMGKKTDAVQNNKTIGNKSAVCKVMSNGGNYETSADYCIYKVLKTWFHHLVHPQLSKYVQFFACSQSILSP